MLLLIVSMSTVLLPSVNKVRGLTSEKVKVFFSV